MAARKLILEFTKMEGAGNDFIVVDNRFYHFDDEELAALARRWCDRRRGVGADGLLALSPAEEEKHDFRMRYLNADGSLASMCGNGARCLARFARNAGLGGEELAFETDAGVFRAKVPVEDGAAVRLFVPPPRDYLPDFALEEVALDVPAHYLWTGTQHVVTFVEDVQTAPVDSIGPRVRSDPSLAPDGSNVNFVEVVNADVLQVRTFEKGVEAETLACGTGALAAALVTRLQGYATADEIDVQMPGGTLTVGARLAEGTFSDVYLEGPARTVFRGTLEVDV